MAIPHPTTPILTDAQRRRVFLEEQLRQLSRPLLSSPRRLFAYVGGPILLGLYFTFVFWRELRTGDLSTIFLMVGLVIGMPAVSATMEAVMRSWYRTRLASEEATVRTIELQEQLDENFVTNLIKINFKYIDKYYYQTQVQANKSFLLSAAAAVVSLGVVIAGIAMLYRADVGSAKQWAGVIATIAGVLGQFISAVFFYLYNTTIAKMSEYHQKLVLTQNLSLALKITEELQGDARVGAQLRLVDYLAADINAFLTGARTTPKGPPSTPRLKRDQKDSKEQS